MRSHQADVAAIEQWTPLIYKIAYKAARRAAAIGVPISQEDFVQELSITVLKCHDSFNPEFGVKMITFLHRAMYNEVNKLLKKDSANTEFGFKVSGDTTWDSDGDGADSAWDYVEDDQERSPENSVMDKELIDWVHQNIDAEASAILKILYSGHQLVSQQLHAYNDGIAEEAQLGGIRRLPMDMNFNFICRLLGFNHNKQAKLGKQVQAAISSYGSR